jgi:hypothetical protein
VSSFSCPACGGPVEFRSAAPFTVCSHCQSLLVRRDADVESVGRVAAVPDDLSPLQLRTTGVFEGRHFTLIGRVRKAWDEGSWSEWCASFDGGSLGWLAENQGDLVMTFERPRQALASATAPQALAAAGPGTDVRIDGRSFIVSDIKQVRCVGAEGELTESALSPVATSIDLHGPGVEFATVEVAGSEVRVFTGRFVEFSECRFAGLRALGDWSPEPPTSGAR